MGTALPVPADRWRGGQHDRQHRDGWRVWQHQAPDGVPALHAGGGHRGRECALRQEQRLLQPVRGLSLYTVFMFMLKYIRMYQTVSIFDITYHVSRLIVFE